jgi:hypothetical protein
MSVSARFWSTALLALAVALVGCGHDGAGPEYTPATIHFTLDGTIGCAPPAGERARQDAIAQQAQLTPAEATRLCILADSVRHAQWTISHIESPADRSAMKAKIQPRIDGLATGIVSPDHVAAVKNYLNAP